MSGDPQHKADEAAETMIAPIGGASAAPSHVHPASSGTPSVLASQVLAGRYEILGMLGVGGMGTVYKARDRELEEVVALKTLRRELVDAPEMLERFRREVKLARRVTHPNVARVFDIGEHEGERFLTMEFVDGEPLGHLLARKGALPVARGVELAGAICAGVAAAHAAGVVHRDLKPDNVLLAKNGRVVVTDFGIARAALEPGAGQTLGGLVGTPAYMAPEQVEGSKDIDARADVYALGALLFEVFTGRRPWMGDAPIAVAAARLVQPPPDPRTHRADLPTALAEILLRCMARRREDRFPDVRAVASELAGLTLPAVSARSPTSAGKSVAPPSALPTTPAVEKTVAVVPFKNTGSADEGYLADELTDDLIDALSMTPRLRVCARSAMARYRGGDHDSREVGRELGVQVVVEGSVRKAAGRVRVAARLVSVADGFQIWAKRFDRPEQDVLAVNDEVAKAIAAALTVDLALPAREAPNDPVTVDLYLRARHEYRKFWPNSMQAAVDLFDQALARSPDDPIVLAGAALAYARLAFFLGVGIDKAMSASERAVALAPGLGDAHLALANTVFQLGDTPRAVRELRAAIARNPGLAEAHASLGRILLEVGAIEDGIRRLEAAIQLDPAVPLAHASLARNAAIHRRWEDVEALLETATLHDGEAAGWTARARTALWRNDQEGAAYLVAQLRDQTAYSGLPAAVLAVMRERRFPDESPMVVFANDVRPGSQRRRTFFLQLIAEARAYLGQEDLAIEALGRAVDAGLIDLVWLDRCVLFDGAIRSMPTFAAFRAKVAARAAEILAAYRA